MRSLLCGFRLSRQRFGCLCSHRFISLGMSIYNLHFSPVVGELLTAVQAHDIGAGQSRGLRPALSRPLGDGETQILVPAAKKHIKQSRHNSPHPGSIRVKSPTSKFSEPVKHAGTWTAVLELLDSEYPKKVRELLLTFFGADPVSVRISQFR